jgi:hypothetical protein
MGTVTCCAETIICLRKPETFQFTVRLLQPPYSSSDKCDPDRSGTAQDLNPKYWWLEGQFDEPNKCSTGFIANGLEGDRTIQLCGGDGQCLQRGQSLVIGNETYTVVSSSLQSVKTAIAAVSKGSGTAVDMLFGGCGCSAAASTGAAIASGQCQLVLLDRALSKDVDSSPVVIESNASELPKLFGDNLGGGLFRLRLNSANLPYGDNGILSLFIVQGVKGKGGVRTALSRFYSGVSFPVKVI